MSHFSKYSKTSYAEMEKRLLEFWKKEKIFELSVEQRPKEKSYVFYDGPPFITGLPHHGTLLSSIAKDVVPRFQTMRGHRVERRWGWDCHGLPAENIVEQKLKLRDKQAVLDYGLEKYITACRQNMIQTGSLWEESIDRVGRWVEFRSAYKTMDADYMESVWWIFKQLYEKGCIYEGEKVLVYCTRCATPVSKAEIAMDNSYKSVTDPSVYVKFKLRPQNSPLADGVKEDVYFLAWTTTPWTLPANSALAVHPEAEYALVNHQGRTYIAAEARLEAIFETEKSQLDIVARLSGSQLVGSQYEGIMPDAPVSSPVLAADYVALDEGTGIVHLAPAYGEEDFALAQDEGIPLIKNVDDNGIYSSGPWRGQNVWQANRQIAEELLKEGRLLRVEEIEHSYPHCHRCQTRLMYKIHPSWFLNIDQQRSQMLNHNQDINWFPPHIKHGRFQAIVETAPDWNISRDRFWATPFPVWRGQDPQTGEVKTIVVGSYAELAELSGKTLDDYHRPWVDEIKFEKDGVLYERIDKVLDCWFESGSMPLAQHHYPFENKEILEANFPADFIVEYVGQVRAWFYYLHAVSVALFDKPSFKNVIVTGTIVGNDGRKISKSLGNYTDPLELIKTYSADAYRLALIDSPVLAGQDFALTTKAVVDKQRKLDTLRNTLEFFLLYAAADQWQFAADKHGRPPQSQNVFDRWLLVRLSDLTKEMTLNFEAYNLPATTQPLLEFIDDLSNWYVRRNRKRFWKSDSDEDKETAYHTLYFVLYTLAHLLAPLCPFLAEEIYRHLSREGEKPSIHLNDWPQFEFEAPGLVQTMSQVRGYISAGLALRAEAGLKVRQPLSELVVSESQPVELDDIWQSIILEELNLKKLTFVKGESDLRLETQLTPSLVREGLARELIRKIQVCRRQFDLEVENRIKLQLIYDDQQLAETLEEFGEIVKSETLAAELTAGEPDPIYKHQAEFTIGQTKVILSLEKI